tara:strand:- start:96 stop:407 length:312 start_codon:yes stop_codon:yes gene_type:complete
MLAWTIVGIVSLLLFVSLYYNYKFARVILRTEDVLESSLDLLDQRYASISKVLEIPLFYDSPQIRQVINDVKECRNNILFVANEIGTIEGEEIGEDQEEENQA